MKHTKRNHGATFKAQVALAEANRDKKCSNFLSSSVSTPAWMLQDLLQ